MPWVAPRIVTCSRLAVVATACIAISACSATTVLVGSVRDPARASAQVEAGGVPNLFRYIWNQEAFAYVVSVDGSEEGDVYKLVPGAHRYQVELRQDWLRFEGSVVLTATPGEHTLIGHRRGGDFEVSLVRQSDQVEACSCRVRGYERRGTTSWVGALAVGQIFILLMFA